MTERLASIDFRILNFIRRHMTCETLDLIMPKISFAGNGGLIWIITACIMFSDINYRKQSLILLAGLLSGVIVCNLFLKNLVARQRPCHIDSSIKMHIPMPKDHSFPSGHTTSSFIAASILMQVNVTLGWISLAVAALIGFSRLYLYVHFPSDVLAGAVLGTVLGLIVWNTSALVL